MRERDILTDIKKANLIIRSLSVTLDHEPHFEVIFREIYKTLKNWSVWIQYDWVRESECFLTMELELIKIHKRRLNADPVYKNQTFRSLRRKKRIIRDAEHLQNKQELSKKSYGLALLSKRWRESEKLFKPIEYRLWCEYLSAIKPSQQFLHKHYDQVEEIRYRSAQLRYELLQESKTVQRSLSEAEAQTAVRQLMKKWKKIPSVDPYQEQRFWRWTETSIGYLFRKSG